MNRIALLIVCFASVFTAYSQKGLKAMDNGLSREVLCSCTDSFGNVLAVSAFSNDSIVVNKFDITTRKWSFYATLGNIYTSLGLKGTAGPSQRGSCSFLNGKFYFVGNIWSYQNPNTYFRSVMYEFNGTWTKITEFKETNYVSTVQCINFNNSIYLVGSFDTVGFVQTPNGVAIYNGAFFSSANFTGSIGYNQYGPSVSFDISNDTLFMATNSVVYYHVPSTLKWGVFYDSPTQIESIAVSNNYLYLLGDNSVYVLNNFVRIDSLKFTNPNNVFRFGSGKLIGTQNHVLIKNFTTLFQIKNRSSIEPVYNFVGADTNINQVFLKYNNQQLYYHSLNGVINGSNDYHNIVEIEVDSMLSSTFDTLNLNVFRDYNKNYLKDKGEPGSQFPKLSISGVLYSGDGNGNLIYYALNNEDVDISFVDENGQDTCYKVSFSGKLKSKAYNNQTTADILYFPLWRTSLQNRNLIVRSWGGFNERISDTISVNILVNNKDCDQSISSADVALTLDPKTIFVSSVPNYFSKNNNTYTFKLSSIYPNYSNVPIKVKLCYPFGSYQINDKVRHQVRIKTNFLEDTLDNTDSIVTKMVYSRDPNAKFCIPEGKVSTTVKKMRYRIDFQNEGNDVARKVIVIDTIDRRIPAYSFNMVAVSHSNYAITLRDNIITWVFDNINLQPKSTDEMRSKGFVIFDAMLRSQLRSGDSILNKAAIFFDYNAPIITNYARVKIEESKENPDPNSFYSKVNIFPNPTQAGFNFKNLESNEQHLTLYDSKGALVGIVNLNAYEMKLIDVSLWTKGIYMVVNSKGKGVKLIVQ